MHAPLQVCCVFSVTIRVTFDFFSPHPPPPLARATACFRFSLRVELSSCLFSLPSQAAQLCNFGRDVVRVAAASVFLGEGALSSAPLLTCCKLSQVRLLGPSGRSEQPSAGMHEK